MGLLRSPFCKWVLPARLVGTAIVIYGFARVFVAADLAGIVIAVAGSLVLQAASLLEERSSRFQRLENISVTGLMKSDSIPVPSWWTLTKVRAQFPATNDRSFFVTMQDGYLSGIVLPEWIYGVSNDEARCLSMAHVAQPIQYLDAVRQHDSASVAFDLMELLGRHHLPVTDVRENLIGVITGEQIAGFLRDGAALGRSKDTKTLGRDVATVVDERIAA